MQTSCLGKLSQELLIRIARKVEEELQRPLQVGFFSSSFQFIEVVDQQMHVSKPYNQVGGFAPEETGVRVDFFLQLSSISTPNTLGQVFRSSTEGDKKHILTFKTILRFGLEDVGKLSPVNTVQNNTSSLCPALISRWPAIFWKHSKLTKPEALMALEAQVLDLFSSSLVSIC